VQNSEGHYASHCLSGVFKEDGEIMVRKLLDYKVPIIIILLLGLMIECFVFNFQYTKQFVLKPQNLDLNIIQLKDLELDGPSTYISRSSDPYMLIKGLDKLVGNMSLELEYQNSNNVLQVFYTDINNPQFAENASVRLNTSQDQKVYTLNFRFPRKLRDLRIDLVDLQNESVKVKRISINHVAALSFEPLRVLLLYLVLSLIYIAYCLTKRYADKLVRYRYVIALIFFVILVTGKIHGSSIAQWDKYITAKVTESKSSVLVGAPRPIRSDEWLVHTPWILSQVQSRYPIINENIRSDGQNMLLTSVPTLSLDLIGKPFYWGFFLLGKEYGLSWYWVSKIILLFLLSFELAMFLTDENRLLSIVGAFWISLSPVIQWWFDTPAAVVELIIYSQAMIVTAIYFVRNKSRPKFRLLLMALITMSIIGYVSVVYPAIQVPLGYLVLIFLGFIFYTNRKSLVLSKLEIIFGVGCLLLISSSIGFFIYHSLPSLKLLLGTAYPGARFSTGGDLEASYLQLYLINWLLPYKDLSTFSNNCEVSVFYNFMPTIILVFFFVYRRAKVKKGIALALFAYMLFQLSWLLVSYPRAIAKLTLFSFTTGPRLANIVFSLTSVYLSLWIIDQFVRNKPLKPYQTGLICIPVGMLYYYSVMHTPMHEYLTRYLTLLTVGFFVILNYIMLRGKSKLFAILMLALILVSGVTINPISRGTAPLDNKQIVAKILEINRQDPNEKWAAVNSAVNGQLLVAEGLKTFNSVHFYPDMNMWKELDPKGKFGSIYNRYSHVMLNITTEETHFVLNGQDAFNLYLNTKDLPKTEIKYILSVGNLEQYNTKLKQVYVEPKDNLYVYQVVNY
jgi:hypothetical protein